MTTNMTIDKQMKEMKEAIDGIHQMLLSMQTVIGENHQVSVSISSKLDLFEQGMLSNSATKPPKKSRTKAKKSDEKDNQAANDNGIDNDNEAANHNDNDNANEAANDNANEAANDNKPTKKKTTKKRDIDEPEEKHDEDNESEHSSNEKKSVKVKDDEKTTKTPKMPKPSADTEAKSRQPNKQDVFRSLYKEKPEQFDRYLTAEVKKRFENEKNKIGAYYKYMTDNHDDVLREMKSKHNSK
jgi:hypothetical protein